MKKNRTPGLLALLLSVVVVQGFSQSSLYLSEGVTFKITKGTTVFIDNLALTPTTDCIMMGLNSVDRDANATDLASDTYIQRVYHFLKTQATYNGAISIYYKDAELNGLDENNLVLNTYDGASWTPHTSNITRDATSNFVTISGLSNISFNELTLTEITGALPVIISHFTAQNNQCVVNLNWTTDNELNSSYFEVQLSTDGVNYTPIGKVLTSGNSGMKKYYSFQTKLINQNNYFRLHMVDIDGSSAFSQILSVSSHCNSNIITVYPNPVNNVLNITGLSGTNQLKLFNEQGKVIATIETKNTLEKIQTSHLPAGTYILQVIQNNNLIRSIKVVKE